MKSLRCLFLFVLLLLVGSNIALAQSGHPLELVTIMDGVYSIVIPEDAEILDDEDLGILNHSIKTKLVAEMVPDAPQVSFYDPDSKHPDLIDANDYFVFASALMLPDYEVIQSVLVHHFDNLENDLNRYHELYEGVNLDDLSDKEIISRMDPSAEFVVSSDGLMVGITQGVGNTYAYYVIPERREVVVLGINHPTNLKDARKGRKWVSDVALSLNYDADFDRLSRLVTEQIPCLLLLITVVSVGLLFMILRRRNSSRADK